MAQERQAGPELDPAVLPSVRGQQVRLQLFILASNLGNFMRRLGLPEGMKNGP